MTSPDESLRWGRRDAAALAAIALVACALHWPFVLQGRIPLNADWLNAGFEPWKSHLKPEAVHNPELDDPAILHYPLWLTARRFMRQGHWPLWNPHILCGTPLLADTMCNPFDPVNLATLLLPDDIAWGLMILVHFVIAGWGVYVYLRSLGLRRVAGIAAATCYMLNGFFIVWLELKFVVACFCWAFWILWAVDHVVRSLKLRWALLAGLFYAFAVLGGNLHHLLNLTLFVGAYILFRLWRVWRDRGVQAVRTAASTIALGIFFGVCLSAPQWATTYELMGMCSRNPTKYAFDNCLHFYELAAFFDPLAFGHPVYDGFDYAGISLFDRSYLTMNSPYVGAFVLPFMILGAFAARRQGARFFAFMWIAVVGLLLALGVDSIHRALAIVMPIDTLDHHRGLVLPALCGAVLVGFGIDFVCSHRFPDLSRLAIAFLSFGLFCALLYAGGTALDMSRLVSKTAYTRSLSAPLLALAGYGIAAWWLWSSRSRVLPVLGLLVIIAELLYFGQLYNPYVSRDRVYPSTPVIDFLKSAAKGSRILGVEPPTAHTWKGDVIPPSSGLCYGIDDVRGKEGMFPRRTRAFFETLRRRQDTRFIALVHFSHADSRVFDLLGAKYVVSHRPLAAPHLRSVFAGELHVYESQRVLPRVFSCGRAIVSPWEDTLVKSMHARDFDPRAAVLLDAQPELAADADAPPAKTEIQESTPNRVVVSVDAPGDCYLVLTDTNFPGWRATIDGRRAIVQNAHFLLRCVSVPKGKHEVVFEYWPVSFQVGLALCIAALLSAAVGGVVAMCRRSQPCSTPVFPVPPREQQNEADDAETPEDSPH